MTAQLVFQEPPENFTPKMEVAACFINIQGKTLFLQCQPHKYGGSTWGIPGGKFEKGETAQDTVIREIKEETGISLPPEKLKYLGQVYIRLPVFDYIYHMFESAFAIYPDQVVIDPSEHREYRWLTLQEALELPLIPGEVECIYLAYGKELSEVRSSFLGT